MGNKIKDEIQALEEKIKSLKRKQRENEKAKFDKLVKILMSELKNKADFYNDLIKVLEKHKQDKIIIQLQEIQPLEEKTAEISK